MSEFDVPIRIPTGPPSRYPDDRRFQPGWRSPNRGFDTHVNLPKNIVYAFLWADGDEE